MPTKKMICMYQWKKLLSSTGKQSRQLVSYMIFRIYITTKTEHIVAPAAR